MRELEKVVITLDEVEAISLSHVEGLYQEEAARRMNVSRQTLGRILDSAHGKIAVALIEGMAICMEGGVVNIQTERTFQCRDCGHVWNEPMGTGRPGSCPKCSSLNFNRRDGCGRGMGGRGNGRCRRGRVRGGQGGGGAGRGRGNGGGMCL